MSINCKNVKSIRICRTRKHDAPEAIGSRLVSFKMRADNARLPSGDVDTSAPLCKTDPTVMLSTPFYFKLEHNDPVPSVRNLLVYEEIVTTVSHYRIESVS